MSKRNDAKFYSQPNPFDEEMAQHLFAKNIISQTIPRSTPFESLPDLETFYKGLSTTIYTRNCQVEAYKNAHYKHGDWLVRMRARDEKPKQQDEGMCK